jgi:hypothetical protein
LKMSHVPIRTCIGCRSKRPKTGLIRLSMRGGALALGTGEGRGFYICPRMSCLDRALLEGGFRRQIGRQPASNEMDRIRRAISEKGRSGSVMPDNTVCSSCCGGGAVA